MDIWMTWCRRRAKCRYCQKDILVTEPMATGKLWRKGNEESRSFNIRFYWHPQCWVANGMDYLSKNPYVSRGNRGRRSLDLTQDDKDRRLKILQAKASLEQRRRKLKAKFPDKELYMTKIDMRIRELVEELEHIGGVPKSW